MSPKSPLTVTRSLQLYVFGNQMITLTFCLILTTIPILQTLEESPQLFVVFRNPWARALCLAYTSWEH